MKKNISRLILALLAIAAPSAAQAQFKFQAGGQIGEFSQEPSTGDMVYKIGGNEKFRIKTNGRVVVQSGILVGDDADCGAGTKGSVRYTSGTNTWMFCDGAGWQTFTFSGSACNVASNYTSWVSFTGGNSNKPKNTQITSIAGQVVTDSCSADVSISGAGSPQYRVCADSGCTSVLQNWTAGSGTIANGNYIQVRATTANVDDTVIKFTLMIGVTYTEVSLRTASGIRRVFVTSGTYNGDALGGVGGADHYCNSLAAAASRPGIYKAWISDGNTENDPESRFFHDSLSYRQVAGGTSDEIATDWPRLVNFANLMNNFVKDENNVTRAGSAWTNTDYNGRMKSSTAHCSEWRANTTPGRLGAVGGANQTWTDSVNGTNCSTQSLRLYCFQQPDETIGVAGTDYKRVFVTSATYTGVAIAGISGADAKCAARATAGGLGGTYKAWIADSTATSAPATRFTQATVPYRMIDSKNRRIADNWLDLVDGNLNTGIVYDETGAFVNSGGIWTNVKTDGTQNSAANTCSNWSANTGVPVIGYTGNISAGWTNAGAGVNCSTSNHRLLCFEQ